MKKRKGKKGFKPLSIMGDLVVYLYALILAVPLFYAVITAFKSEQERVISPIGLPESFKFDNFVTAWVEGGLLNATKNSIIITCCSTILMLFFVIVVSYCLNRIRDTKTGTALYMLILSSMFIPHVGTATMLLLRRDMGLYNNLFGEIFVSSFGITMGVFLVSGFLRTIPRDLEEAAMIDGASDTQICFRIIAPVIKPSLLTVGILAFKTSWNNALGPLLTLRNEELYTIPMALLLNFTREYATEYTTMFAGVIMTSVPIIIVYCLCQKHFVSAMAGSVKG